MGALNELQYRINLWIQLFNSALALGTGLVAIAVVYAHTETLEGWSAAELLAVLGVHLLIGGFLKTFVVPNMWRLIQDVEEGTLDYTLTRPADSQLLVSVREVSIWSVIDVPLGVGVIIWAMSEMTADVTPIGVAGFLVALMCGAAIIYSIWLAVVTIAFKAINIGDLMQILNGVYEAGRWPVSIYPLWLRGSLTVLIPLAFAITVPAEIITNRINWWWLAAGVAVTVAALFVCRLVWRWGIRNYSGASV
jgi:ABC-2 type transport system permease protein